MKAETYYGGMTYKEPTKNRGTPDDLSIANPIMFWYHFNMSERLFFLISFLMSFVFFTVLALHITGLLDALILGLLITMLGGVLAGCIVLALAVLTADYLKWIAAAVYSRLHPPKA